MAQKLWRIVEYPTVPASPPAPYDIATVGDVHDAWVNAPGDPTGIDGWRLMVTDDPAAPHPADAAPGVWEEYTGQGDRRPVMNHDIFPPETLVGPSPNADPVVGVLIDAGRVPTSLQRVVSETRVREPMFSSPTDVLLALALGFVAGFLVGSLAGRLRS